MSQRVSLEDRAIARIWLYVRDGQVDRSKLERSLRTIPGATEHRSAIVDRLQEFGVRVVESAPPADIELGVDAVEGTVKGAAEHAVATKAVDVIVSTAPVDAARAVLVYDKHRRHRVGRVLTGDEEVGLVTLLRDGRALTEALPNGYRKELVDGSEPAAAFDAMVIHNIRLVYSVANAHAGRVSPSGTVLELDDLAQAGMTGLIRAIELFDASRGLKFSTYATNWIRQSIGREIDNTSRLIRLPVHVMDDMRAIWSAIESLHANGRRVHPDAISDIAELDADKVTRYLDYLKTPASLDLAVDDDESTPLQAFLPSAGETSPEYAFMAWCDAAELNDALNSLDPRSKRILRLRAGLDGDDPMTLDEIGAIYGVTRERIRQIESKAIKQLRGGPFAQQLRRLVGNVHVVCAESGFAPEVSATA